MTIENNQLHEYSDSALHELGTIVDSIAHNVSGLGTLTVSHAELEGKKLGMQNGRLIVYQVREDRISAKELESAIIFQPQEGSEYAHLVSIVQDKTRGMQSLSPQQKARYAFLKNVMSQTRAAVMIHIHHEFGLSEHFEETDNNHRLKAAVDALEAYPALYADRAQTLQAQHMIADMYEAFLASGMVVFFPEVFGSDPLSPELFIKNLSCYSKDEALTILGNIAHTADRISATRLPDRVAHSQTKSVNQKEVLQKPRKDRGPAVEQTSRGYHEIMGISPDLNAASVLGIAAVLGLTDTSKVVSVTDRSVLEGAVHVVYGTTDYANPVEAIMLAEAARKIDGTLARATYEADTDSHTIGSYLQRVLIPTIASVYRLPDTKVQELISVAATLDVHDIDIQALCEMLNNSECTTYLHGLTKITGEDTFKGVYTRLNQILCEQIGINYHTTQEYLVSMDLTVKEVYDYAVKISAAAEAKYSQMREHLENQSDLSAESRAKTLANIWGTGGAWSIHSRQFFRSNSHDEREIPFEEIDPQTKLEDLAGLGITLGGNAWVVAMQIAAEKDQAVNTVVAHKNTKLGMNYCAPFLVSERTVATVSPVVRVVPNGSHAITGDGVDIGLYIMRPQLIKLVQETFQNADSSMHTGQKKVVIELSVNDVWIGGEKEHALFAEIGTEPFMGGNRRQTGIVEI